VRLHRHLLLLEQAVRRKFGSASLHTFVTMLASIEKLADRGPLPPKDRKVV